LSCLRVGVVRKDL
jgi:hypothetical protein